MSTIHPNGPTAVVYCRVSTDRQAKSGLGLEAQEAAGRRIAAEKGWQAEVVVDAGVSGRVAPDDRPALGPALQGLKAGRFCALITSTIDRLSRKTRHSLDLAERSQDEGWELVVGGIPDIRTPTGYFHSTVMAAVAQLERQTMGQRISDALQAKKARGQRLGCPVQTPDRIRAYIERLHRQGESASAIARRLNEAGVPTVRGGRKWWPSTVKGVLRSLELDREAEAARAERTTA